MIIVQGDNGTVINEVFKKNGVAVDLTGATVQVYVKINESMYTKNVTITDAINGLYDITINSNDVVVTGLYYYQAYATFTSGKRISSDIDRFIVTKRLDGIPVDPSVPGDGGTVGEVNPDLLRIGISANGKLTIDGVEQTGGGGGTGLLTYATLADLQAAHPNGTTQPVWVVAENSWYYWDGGVTEPTPDTTTPNNVTNLAYSNVSATGVTLTWTASTSTDVANYQIYRDGVNIGQASETEFIVSGLTASTAYAFTVKAKDTSANEASGVSVNVTTNGLADTTAPVLTITPAATFADTQQVTMSTNETATIYYTLDGSTPTTASSVYSTALTLSAATTVKAFARDTAGNNSAVQTVVYTKQEPSGTTGYVNDSSLLLFRENVTNPTTLENPDTYFNGSEPFALVMTVKMPVSSIALARYTWGQDTSNKFQLATLADGKFNATLYGKKVSNGATSYPQVGSLAHNDLASVFYHVVVVRDSDSLDIYVNNVKEGTVSLTDFTFNASTMNLVVGQSGKAITIKNILYYNRALTTEELTQNYNTLKE